MHHRLEKVSKARAAQCPVTGDRAATNSGKSVGGVRNARRRWNASYYDVMIRHAMIDSLRDF